ncbi:hypothetical protein [Thermocrinis sp.]|uniref:hypothetical protein n=1 Tax=Thermocrinis sp. TaxID=2024383 RepID=UPI002FDC7DAA
MRIRLRLFDIKDIDELIFRLSGIGVGLEDVYKQLEEGGAKSLEIFVDENQLSRVRSALEGLCQLEIVYTKESFRAVPLLLLGILWMDNALLYFLLKLSLLSQDFNYFLSSILRSSKLVEIFKSLISLMAIGVYYSGFVLAQNTTPVGRLFGLKVERDRAYFIVLFSLPLVAFKLLQFDQTILRLLGLFILSLCLVLPFYFQSSVKYL